MKRVYIFCLAPACLLLSNMAMAQQESEAVIEDIVVTAQKREQPLQEVPIAISCLSRTVSASTGIPTPCATHFRRGGAIQPLLRAG